MAPTIAEMTRDELQELIETSVERKLLELFRDPDEGLELKKEIRARLRRSFAAEARGDRGVAAEDLAKRLGLRM